MGAGLFAGVDPVCASLQVIGADVLVPGAVFALMAATYYWLPKFTGNMYSEKWGKIHFWLSAIFVNVLFFPQHYLGLAGMPRRIPDYSPQFADFNMISSKTGWNFNDKDYGGFEVPTYEGQYVGPGLSFVEGGTLQWVKPKKIWCMKMTIILKE